MLPRVSQKSILEAKKIRFRVLCVDVRITNCDSFAGGNFYVTKNTFFLLSSTRAHLFEVSSLRVDYKFKLRSRLGSNSLLPVEIVCVLYSRDFLADLRLFSVIERRRLLFRCRLKTKTSSARFCL